LNIKKATGFDGISAKMIKLAKPVLTGPITSLINKSNLYSRTKMIS
jgi:hypothetical protein